jgi:hypothetical protein
VVNDFKPALKPGSVVAAQVTDEVDYIKQKRHGVHSYQGENPAAKKKCPREYDLV